MMKRILPILFFFSSAYVVGKASVYLIPKKKSLLENHGQEGEDKVQMPNDGIELIAPGKSAYVFTMKKTRLRKFGFRINFCGINSY